MPRVRRLVPLALALLPACGDSAPASEIVPAGGFGTPRQLIYVVSGEPIPKHGATTSTPGSVHVFERDTFASVGFFSVGRGPENVNASADGRYVFVTNAGSGTATFLDTQTWERRTLTLGVRPNHSFVSPDHSSVWIGNDGSASVSVVRFEDLSVIGPVTTGAGHHKIAFATEPGGAFARAYVSNIVDGTVTPVSPQGVASLNVPGTGFGPHGMDFASSNGRIYDCTDTGIDVIATRDEPGTPEDDTSTVVARIALPARCSYLRIDEDGTHAVATIPSMASLVRMRLSDHQVEQFPVASDPDTVVVTGDHAFVSSLSAPVVSFVDFSGAIPAGSIDVGNAGVSGHRPIRLDGDLLFVPNLGDDSVSLVDVTTRTVVHTLTEIESPVDVAVAGPSGGTVYPR